MVTPADDFSVSLIMILSFFCGPESSTQLLHSMIYDFQSQQCMKNKLNFPKPFSDQPPPPPAAAVPTYITPASLPTHAHSTLAVKHEY